MLYVPFDVMNNFRNIDVRFPYKYYTIEAAILNILSSSHVGGKISANLLTPFRNINVYVNTE